MWQPWIVEHRNSALPMLMVETTTSVAPRLHISSFRISVLWMLILETMPSVVMPCGGALVAAAHHAALMGPSALLWEGWWHGIHGLPLSDWAHRMQAAHRMERHGVCNRFAPLVANSVTLAPIAITTCVSIHLTILNIPIAVWVQRARLKGVMSAQLWSLSPTVTRVTEPVRRYGKEGLCVHLVVDVTLVSVATSAGMLNLLQPFYLQ